MKKLNKKGFTLIELLAVIVVLAIIMVIATTSITSAMNNARVNSFIDSYKMIKKEIKNRNALDGSGITDTTETIVCDDTNSVDSDNCSDVYDISAADYSVKVTGDATNGYTIFFAVKGVTSVVSGTEKGPGVGADAVPDDKL